MRVAELLFDDVNEEKLAGHGVRAWEVRQVLDEAPVFFRNKQPNRATHIMVGPTFGGRLLTVPIEETAMPGVWRPVTAFDAGPQERARYEAATRASRGR